MLGKLRLIGSWFVGLLVVSLLIMGDVFVARRRARDQYHYEAEA